MISPQFYPIVGGYERACERLSIGLAARGHVVSVWTERRDRAWPKSEVIHGVAVRRGWCIYQPKWHLLSSLLSFIAYILRYGRSFEVWHVHQYGVHSTFAVVLGKVMRRQVVLKLTNTAHMGLFNIIANSRFPWLMVWLHKRMDAIVALTRESAAEAEAFGIVPTRINILGNGVDTQVYRPVNELDRRYFKSVLKLADNQEVVLFVGRLSMEKNVSCLLRAWAKVQSSLGGSWTLVIVGDGPMRKALTDEAMALAVNSTVLFEGLQDNIPQWLAAASIYTLPSVCEGLSNSLLEAMASGLPVVVSRVSGAIELVEETDSGFVVPVGNSEALASALGKLADSKLLRQEMGARGRSVIEKRYSIDRVVALHEEMYARLQNCS